MYDRSSNAIFIIDTDDYDPTRVSKKTYVSKTAGSEGTEYEILNLNPQGPHLGDADVSEIDERDDPESGDTNVLHYRSVVCRNGRVLAMGVPKGLELADFRAKYPVESRERGEQSGRPDLYTVANDLYVSEVVEGTMINLFYDPEAQSWEIATKGAVGGNYWFLRTQYPSVGQCGMQLTFRQMFLEACGCDLREGTDINEIPFLAEFHKDMVYSFVLQHPLNHIVSYINAPALWLVAVYWKANCGRKIEYITPVVYQTWDVFWNTPVPIHFPKRYEFGDEYGNYEGLITWVSDDGLGFDFTGVMITNMETGERCRVENPDYLKALELRGNHPNLQYHFLTLLKENRAEIFLVYFPWYAGIFGAFHRQFLDFVRGVYMSYIDRYIRKIVVVGGVLKQYMPHIWRLHHNVYLPSVANGSKTVIEYVMVENYMLSLEAKEIIHYLNM